MEGAETPASRLQAFLHRVFGDFNASMHRKPAPLHTLNQIAEGAKLAPFNRVFVPKFVDLANRSAASRSCPSALLELLSWSCALFSASKPVPTQVIRSQSLLLSALSLDIHSNALKSAKAAQKIRSMLYRALAANEELPAAYVAHLRAQSRDAKVAWETFVLACAVFASVQGRRPSAPLEAFVTELQDCLPACYASLHTAAALPLMAKWEPTLQQPLPQGLLALLGPALRALRAADLGATVVPAFERGMCRNPSIALWAAASTLPLLGADASAQHAGYLRHAIQTLESPRMATQDAQRNNAVVLLVSLARRCSDTAALQAMVDQTLASMTGRIAQWQLRAALADALMHLAAVVTTRVSDVEQIRELAARIADRIAAYLAQARGDSPDRANVLHCLGRWLSLLEDLPQAVSRLFVQKIPTSVDTARRAYLHALTLAFQQRCMWPKAGALVAPLSKFLKANLSKAALRADLFLGAAALACIAAGGEAEVDMGLIASVANNAPLYAPATVASASQAECEAHSLFAARLLEDHSALALTVEPPFFASLYQLFAHPIPAVRAAAHTDLSRALTSHDADSETWVARIVESSAVFFEVESHPALCTPPAPPVPAQALSPAVLQRALLIACGLLPAAPPAAFTGLQRPAAPRATPPPREDWLVAVPDVIAPLLLRTAHAPALASRDLPASWVWSSLLAACPSPEAVQRAGPPGFAPPSVEDPLRRHGALMHSMIAFLTSAQGIQSENPICRQSAVRALGTMTTAALYRPAQATGASKKKGSQRTDAAIPVGALAAHALVTLVEKRLDALRSMTDYERAVAVADPKHLVPPPEAQQEGAARTKQDKNVRRNHTQKGLYSVEDEEWEREVRQKQSQESEEVRRHQEHVAALARQAEVRRRIESHCAPVISAVAALIEILKSESRVGRRVLPRAVALASELLVLLPQSPEIKDLALVLCRSIGAPHLVGLAARKPPTAPALTPQDEYSLGAAFIRTLLPEQPFTPNDELLPRLLARVLGKLQMNAMKGILLPACATRLLLPILRDVIVPNRAALRPLLSFAITVLGKHAAVPSTRFDVPAVQAAGEESECPAAMYVDFPRDEVVQIFLSAHQHVAAGAIPGQKMRPRVLQGICRDLVMLAEGATGLDELESLAHQGLLSDSAAIRRACIDALAAVPGLADGSFPQHPRLTAMMWYACQDADLQAFFSACRLWLASQRVLSPECVDTLLPLVRSSKAHIRATAARALGAGCGAPSRATDLQRREQLLQARFLRLRAGGVDEEQDDDEDEAEELREACRMNTEEGWTEWSSEESAVLERMTTIEPPFSAPQLLQEILDVYTANLPPQIPTEAPSAAAVGGKKKLVKGASAGAPLSMRQLREEAEHMERQGRPARSGAALALAALCPALCREHLPIAASFFMQKGFGDQDDTTREQMLRAALRLVSHHGADSFPLLLPLFEAYLAQPAPDSLEHDYIRAGVILSLGALARYLPSDSPKIADTLEHILKTLKVPSEPVQRCASRCLSRLIRWTVQANREMGMQLSRRLLDSLVAGSYGERRGAAYGLAGMVKGLGVPVLQEFGIFEALKTALEDKNHPNMREGALLALEILFDTMRTKMEIYIVHVMPLLLTTYSDTAPAVRKATSEAARTLMQALTEHGVSSVLRQLTHRLNDKNWRTKLGAIELLGSMAYCAPKQLAFCLPDIVPRLANVLMDTHIKVQTAAQDALRVIGSVIQNAAVKKLVPVLLDALMDPAKTHTALHQLANEDPPPTLDAPSLSLVVPICRRGLHERQIETKRMAALIAGNFCLMCSRDVLLPYIQLLLPDLRQVLCDPIPDVRSTVAKSFGMWYQGLGEDAMEGVVPWLIDTVATESSQVERSGAAQGLCEVIAAQGVALWEEIMPRILQGLIDPQPHVVDGNLHVFLYLPVTLADLFQPYIESVFESIVNTLAHDQELVRETSTKVCRIFVELYGVSCFDLLLASLQRSLVHPNWRIRHSTTMLLGELLHRAAGTRTTLINIDETARTEAISRTRAIFKLLGPERKANVLASLYLARCDTSPVVRQTAVRVWKSVVSNSPKALREILPLLINILIGHLATDSEEKREIARHALTDIAAKLAERVVPTIMPLLHAQLRSTEDSSREGACHGLTAVLSNANRQLLQDSLADIMPSLRQALCDPSERVRKAAAHSFGALMHAVGHLAVEEIIPRLLDSLGTEEEELALEGLKEVLAIKSGILSQVLPKLIKPPMTLNNARALAGLASAAGPTLARSMHTILPVLLQAIDADHAIEGPAAKIVCSVTANEHALIGDLIRGLTEMKNPEIRRGSAFLLGAFLKGSPQGSLTEHYPVVLRSLTSMLADPEAPVIQASLKAIQEIVSIIPRPDLAQYVMPARDALSALLEHIRNIAPSGTEALLPAFTMPGGLKPLLPIFVQGLSSGSPEIREKSVETLGEMILASTPQVLSASVMVITGPMIRVIGDKFVWKVKVAILKTFSILLERGGLLLKAFLPQLQLTFVKTLQDPTKEVRVCAARALSQLVGLTRQVIEQVPAQANAFLQRANTLVNELHNSIQQSHSDIRDGIVYALGGVMANIGAHIAPPTRQALPRTLLPLLHDDSGTTRTIAAEAVGLYARCLPEDELQDLLRHLLDWSSLLFWEWIQAHLLCLRDLLAKPDLTSATLSDIGHGVDRLCSNEQGPVRQIAVECSANILRRFAEVADFGPDFQLDESSDDLVVANVSRCLASLVRALSDAFGDIRLAAGKGLRTFATECPEIASTMAVLDLTVPKLLTACRDRSFPVKYQAERALRDSLQLTTGPHLLERFAQRHEGTTVFRVADLVSYSTRVLSKLVDKEQ